MITTIPPLLSNLFPSTPDDRIPSREELDIALLKARQDTVIKDMAGQHNIPQFTTVAPAQLPLLAKLAVATSSGRVKIIVAHVS